MKRRLKGYEIKEYKIEIVESDHYRRYVKVKINGEETLIEKVTRKEEEEWDKLMETHKKIYLDMPHARYIEFLGADCEKALAVYRLLLY